MGYKNVRTGSFSSSSSTLDSFNSLNMNKSKGNFFNTNQPKKLSHKSTLVFLLKPTPTKT
eukprot:Pgem_evm2s19377